MIFGASVLSLALSDTGPECLLPDFDASENELDLAERAFCFRWREVGLR